MNIKKIIMNFSDYLFHRNKANSNFQLLNVEKDAQEEDSPIATTYTYTCANPLLVSYRYGFNVDMNSYELSIKFNDADAMNTQLRSVYLAVSDDDQQFLKQLTIPDFKPKRGCYYYGNAEVGLDEVWVAVFEFAGSEYGCAYLKYIKALDD